MSQDRITELEKRLAAAEARIAAMEAAWPMPTTRDLWKTVPASQWPYQAQRGCICPPGAEFGCNSAGCPRRGIGPAPVTCGGGT